MVYRILIRLRWTDIARKEHILKFDSMHLEHAFMDNNFYYSMSEIFLAVSFESNSFSSDCDS